MRRRGASGWFRRRRGTIARRVERADDFGDEKEIRRVSRVAGRARPIRRFISTPPQSACELRVDNSAWREIAMMEPVRVRRVAMCISERARLGRIAGK
eukprot:2171465-Pleurochrysis_carterae.AAC.1